MNNFGIWCGVLLLMIGVVNTTTFAQEVFSPNFGVQPINGSKLEGSSSGNFVLPCATVGNIEPSYVDSANYATFLFDLCRVATYQIQFTVLPEKRVGVFGTNQASMNTEFSIRPAGGDPFGAVLYRSVDLGTTFVNGVSPVHTVTIPNLSLGYDLVIKTEQGLTRKVSGIFLSSSSLNTIDFSQASTVFVKAGDSAGSVFGDNKVNSLDIGTTIGDLNGSTPRPDYNRDGKINALDIGIMIFNLNQVGE